LIEVIKINYVHMGRYLEALLSTTSTFFNLMRCHEDNDDLREIAGYSIEIWNTLCEEELTNKEYCLVKQSVAQDHQPIWKSLATLMLQGLSSTGLDLELDHSLEDDSDSSFAHHCAQGLRFVSQVIGNEMLDMTYHYVTTLLSGSKTWHNKYIALMALSSCMEGPDADRLCQMYNESGMSLFNWVVNNASDQSERVRCSTGNLIVHIAQYCP
jgi:hypothetical protein